METIRESVIRYNRSMISSIWYPGPSICLRTSVILFYSTLCYFLIDRFMLSTYGVLYYLGWTLPTFFQGLLTAFCVIYLFTAMTAIVEYIHKLITSIAWFHSASNDTMDFLEQKETEIAVGCVAYALTMVIFLMFYVFSWRRVLCTEVEPSYSCGQEVWYSSVNLYAFVLGTVFFLILDFIYFSVRDMPDTPTSRPIVGAEKVVRFPIYKLFAVLRQIFSLG